jgi:hypothetical protein
MTTTSLGAANLDVGRVIQTTFGVIGRNFAVFALLGVCFAGLPSLLAGLGRLGVLQERMVGLSVVMTVAAAVVQFMGSYVLQGALTHGAIADLNGRKASFAACLGTGLRNALPLLGLGILSAIALVFGFLLLVFPALMMLTAWAVTVPALVTERRGVLESFGRSADLTRGRRWPVFGLLLLFAVASWIIQLVVVIPAGAFASVTPGGLLPLQTVVAAPIAAVFQGMLGATGGAVLYFELRRIKEGVGVEALASIFD